MVNRISKHLNWLVLAVVLMLPSVGFCTPDLVIPSIETTYIYDAAEAVFAVIAVVIAIVVGIRLFKKA